MKHLHTYNKYEVKEEINLKNIALAGGISLASMLGKDIKSQPRQTMNITQQQKASLVPQEAYKAVELIESVFSFTDFSTGRILGSTYNGKEKETIMKNYIDKTIGLENWFKIGKDLRGMIYQYMFQHDSGSDIVRLKTGEEVNRNWWISGLAQAIDPTLQRPSINEKPLTNSNVQSAIKTIVSKISDGTIDSYYDDYKKVIDNQYSLTKSASLDNYKNVWRYRPTAFERLMKGENWNVIKKDWFDSIKTGIITSTNKPSLSRTEVKVSSTEDIAQVEVINSPYLDTLYADFKKFVNNERENYHGSKIEIDLKSLSLKDSSLQLILRYKIVSDKGFDTYSILFNEVSTIDTEQEKMRTSLNRAKKLNPGLQVIQTGTIMAKSNLQSRLKKYEYHLVGINIQ